MNAKERAEVVKEIMKEQDMTCARLQRKIKVNINTIYSLFKGTREPTLSTINKVADGLGIKPSKLI